MLIGIDGSYSPPPPPPPKPPPPPEIPTATTGHAFLTSEYSRSAPPLSPDRVSPNDPEGFRANAEDWLKENSPAVAALAHGVVDAPGVVGRQFREASKVNTELAEQLEKTVSTWSTDVPSVRSKNIAKLSELAKGKSEPIEKLATELSAENAAPHLLHAVGRAVGAPVARAVDKFGESFKSSIDKAIASFPKTMQGTLRNAVSAAEHRVSTAVDGIKAGAQAKIADELPSALGHRAESTVASLRNTAEKQSTEAASRFRNGSRLIGYSPGDVADLPKVAKNAPKVGKVLDHLSALRDTPFLDYGLVGAGIFLDRGKGLADATVANVGSTLAGSEIQGLATKAVTRIPSLTTSSFGEAAGEEVASTAAVDGTETAVAAAGVDAALPEVAGAVAATGPIGVAVVGTVVVGAVAAYGVTKIIESQAGQDIIGGIAHLNGG
ncbi:MAG: hypothetical protein IAI50_14715, partial [Candidatus Eremiobacteraeota bacterium]|nr:hypothetical protein [Candidatus Eremiobacteraeota bacterium]